MASESPDPDVEVPGGGCYGETSRCHSYLGYSKCMMLCGIIPKAPYQVFFNHYNSQATKWNLIKFLLNFRVWSILHSAIYQNVPKLDSLLPLFKNSGMKPTVMVPLFTIMIRFMLCYIHKWIIRRIDWYINFGLVRPLKSSELAFLTGTRKRGWETNPRYSESISKCIYG